MVLNRVCRVLEPSRQCVHHMRTYIKMIYTYLALARLNSLAVCCKASLIACMSSLSSDGDEDGDDAGEDDVACDVAFSIWVDRCRIWRLSSSRYWCSWLIFRLRGTLIYDATLA